MPSHRSPPPPRSESEVSSSSTVSTSSSSGSLRARAGGATCAASSGSPLSTSHGGVRSPGAARRFARPGPGPMCIKPPSCSASASLMSMHALAAAGVTSPSRYRCRERCRGSGSAPWRGACRAGCSAFAGRARWRPPGRGGLLAAEQQTPGALQGRQCPNADPGYHASSDGGTPTNRCCSPVTPPAATFIFSRIRPPKRKRPRGY
jgi:hypothetical protein